MFTEDLLVSITSNPLLLLGVGAGISGLLVPYFTRKWQDGQKELELKMKLLENIGMSVTQVIRSTESIENQSGNPLSEKQSWHNACPIIGAHIHTYFHRSKRKIPDYWENYKYVVHRFCDLFEKDNVKDREVILGDIISYIDQIKTKTKYNVAEKKIILADKNTKSISMSWRILGKKYLI